MVQPAWAGCWSAANKMIPMLSWKNKMMQIIILPIHFCLVIVFGVWVSAILEKKLVGSLQRIQNDVAGLWPYLQDHFWLPRCCCYVIRVGDCVRNLEDQHFPCGKYQETFSARPSNSLIHDSATCEVVIGKIFYLSYIHRCSLYNVVLVKCRKQTRNIIRWTWIHWKVMVILLRGYVSPLRDVVWRQVLFRLSCGFESMHLQL